MEEHEKLDKVPLLREKPIINYTKQYDQVSWHSADTDFEPGLSSTDGRKRQKKAKTSRRKQKIAALIIVVFVFLAVMVGLIYLYVAKGDDYVKVACGKISGKQVTTNYGHVQSRSIYKYLGIPYALPPVRRKRWAAPVKTPAGYCGKDIFIARSIPKRCLGRANSIGSEDCLYLNVYTPFSPGEVNNLISVIVIFDREYSGSSDSLHVSIQDLADSFAASMQAVVVTVNYRVGVFGFLALEGVQTANSTNGNYGILDQLLSIKWVEENIEVFGGNKNLVTIIGGSSIFYLLAVKSNSEVNFHRALAMSGSPYLNTTYKLASTNNQKFLMNNSMCSSKSQLELLECLQKLTSAEVQEIFHWNFTTHWDLPEKGVFEPGLVTADPVVNNFMELEENKSKNKIKGQVLSILLGNTAQEIGQNPLHSFKGKTIDEYIKFLTNRLNLFSPDFSKTVVDMYGDVLNTSIAELAHETIASDVRVVCPTNVLKHSLEKNPNFLVFRYVVDSEMKIAKTYAYNGIDFLALFTTSSSSELFNVGEKLRDNLKHFIEFGHPLTSNWNTRTTAVLDIKGSDVTILQDDYHKEKCAFWNDPKNAFVQYAWKN